MEKLVCSFESENTKVVELIFKKLKEKNSNILLLIGTLGAGKTTLTYELSKHLNTMNQVSSPTFVIQKIYNLEKNKLNFSKIYHLDLYRLTDREEIDNLNLFEDINDKKNLFIIEWPEKVMNEFTNAVVIKIEVLNDDKRGFEIG